MRILVAGGAGFLGSNLCKKLLEEKDNYVICLDNFSSGKKENIEDIENNERFELVESDIINKIDLDIDQIYNAACLASPKFYQEKSLETFDTCVVGTRNLLDLAKKYNAKFLQFSTSEIYGDPLEHPQNEKYYGNVNTMGIRSCYDEGKRAAETLCFLYNKKYNIKTKVVRIFNTYGPYMRKDDGRVISNFITKALRNEDIEVYGDGNQTRSLCYVDDLLDGIIKMMSSNDDIIGPINLGNSYEVSINDLAQKIIKLTNSNSKIIYKELPQDDPVRRKPDITCAQNILGYSPKVSLEEGLNYTIEFYKKNA